MDEDPADIPFPGMEPLEDDLDDSIEMESSSRGDAAADGKEDNSTEPREEEDEAKAAGSEPAIDWFEPLEDEDEAFSLGKPDPEEESLAGESERSESVVGSEKAYKRKSKLPVVRRKRATADEGWIEWPVLGEGWKRKEVVRRSGSSIGQIDVYYLSPYFERVRSRVELLSVLEGEMEMSHFDYKTGRFLDKPPPIRVRRAKRRIRERSSSESSFMERGEGADTPDSNQSFTPTPKPKAAYSRETSSSFTSMTATPSSAFGQQSGTDKIKLPSPSSSRQFLLPAIINGDVGLDDNPLICAQCGTSFIGTSYDKQRKKPCCRTCWAMKTKEHPLIRFRKWIPCGQCVGCYNTVNCGLCVSCKFGQQAGEMRKRLCRRRKCISPIRKDIAKGESTYQKFQGATPEIYDDNSDHGDSQHPSLKNSDTENLSFNVDNEDEDDMSTDDDDDWHKKRKRRACGECKACLCRRDCGTCDFCIDKPKFGGSNKKRQKCRQRQCQRQAMRHLLPFQMGMSDLGPDGTMMAGRQRPHYTYSRKSSLKRNRGLDIDWSDNEDDDSNLQPMNWSSEPVSESKDTPNPNLNQSAVGVQNGFLNRVLPISNHKAQLGRPARLDTETSHAHRGEAPKQVQEQVNEGEGELPTIANVFSYAEPPTSSGSDGENQLLKLLHSLRSSVLPIMWYAILVEGPQLQLIQCSKQSTMTDTMVLIDPGFCYQITVQKQPLLPTHPLYDSHPGPLASITDVVNLLLALEKLGVCHGLPYKDSPQQKEPIILERASTCDFLVEKNVSVCSNCKALLGL